tara:strand:+ start:57669 stop:57956 length:288 start_codon:yes stop_codon:yes gene_type:complete
LSDIHDAPSHPGRARIKVFLVVPPNIPQTFTETLTAQSNAKLPTLHWIALCTILLVWPKSASKLNLHTCFFVIKETPHPMVRVRMGRVMIADGKL